MMMPVPIIFIMMFVSSCGRPPLLDHRREESHSSNEGGRPRPQSEGENGTVLELTQLGLLALPVWVEGPRTPDESRLRLSFVKKSAGAGSSMASPLPSGVSLEVELWMPDMGHGSSPVEIFDRGEGVFDVREIYFTMPGKWQLIVRLREQDRVLVEKILLLEL